jgi:uncharacterized membrane protein
MPPAPSYNKIAGQNVARLAALSDGVFAVAMTLLVLDLHAPAASLTAGDAALWQALIALLPRIAVYLMSFVTLGIFWVGQQTQLNFFTRTDRHLTWINLAFLFAVSLMPFSTGLLASFIGRQPALLAYWFNILVLGLTLLINWRYACKSGMVGEKHDQVSVGNAIEQRIIAAQILYGIGAGLSFVSFWLALGLIFTVQSTYVFGLPLEENLQFLKRRSQ